MHNVGLASMRMTSAILPLSDRMHQPSASVVSLKEETVEHPVLVAEWLLF